MEISIFTQIQIFRQKNIDLEKIKSFKNLIINNRGAILYIILLNTYL